jgi:hypothetical protein
MTRVQKKFHMKRKKSITKEPSGDTFENWNTGKEKEKKEVKSN